ncbi:MAG: hypothetical protein F4Z75_04425 [Synechococcus sp. SB0668_bin_15]|nr:hypothetical protein [Synechococcus sp. SB0668_bin_15]
MVVHLTPTVAITAGSGINEDTAAASPSPPIPPLLLPSPWHRLGTTQAAGATGSKTVTIPSSGTATYSVATVDDSTDEADGSVSVTVNTGNGYTVGSTATATVAVSDDDPTTTDATPSFSIPNTIVDRWTDSPTDITYKTNTFTSHRVQLAGNNSTTTADNLPSPPLSFEALCRSTWSHC